MIRLLRTYLPRVAPYVVGLMLFQVGVAFSTLYMPRISADIIDKGVLAGDTDYIWARGGWMLTVAVALMLCALCSTYFAARASMGFGRFVREDLFHRVTSFSAQEVGHFGAPSLITRITNDVNQVQLMLMMAGNMAINAPVMAIGGLIFAINEDVGLTWVLAGAVPILLACVIFLVSKMHPVFSRMQDQIDDVNQVLREQITGIRVIRAFTRERAETERFDGANSALTGTGLLSGKLMAFLFPTVMLVQNGASIAVLWVGAGRIDSGALSIGSLIAFLSYIIQVLMAVMMATFMVVMLPRAAVSGGRIQEVLSTDPSVEPPEDAKATVESGSVAFDNVSFGYPGAEVGVLTDVSLVARPGQTTAIIGSTGAGKTTLLNLIPRLFDVTAGTVRVDGIDVRELEPEDLWSRVGLVPQKAYLFSGTIASNLRMGKPDATEAEMWEALTVAQGREFVAALPGGLDAPVNQGGANFSGGQRQRLSIARALIRKPEIYVFDDSFSALDLSTEARLREALEPRIEDSTVLVVAQRVSTIIDADQILVLEDGRTVGLGTHTELLETCPTYGEIVESQMSAEQAA